MFYFKGTLMRSSCIILARSIFETGVTNTTTRIGMKIGVKIRLDFSTVSLQFFSLHWRGRMASMLAVAMWAI